MELELNQAKTVSLELSLKNMLVQMFNPISEGLNILWMRQGWARPDLDHRDRDRDWKCLSLNNETETETEKVWVSMTRPRPRLKMLSLNNETETETGKIWVSKTRLGKKCRYRDSIETHADLWYDTGLLVGWSRFFLPYRAYSAIKSQTLMQ